ncbi:hypothetical protein LWF15_20110 [Kineosporia rhizophila]|uniref:hypothetical protein n=1 Tax=Kineosporia rhizophila TaxID=84633 RepID=UPI000AACF15E|nr:hypothetical protein [Kineosporia rhizophila]MCE0537802.1 hypothetical protein [Kineosporia rhizophila]
MSKIDELAEAISGLTLKIDEASTASGGSAQGAEEAGAVAADLGARNVVEGLAQVKAQLDELTELLQGISQQAAEIQTLTLSLADNG